MASQMLTAKVSILALAGSMVFFSSQVLAHAHLRQQIPVQGSVQAVSPQEIRLTFSEDIEASFSGVTLTGPNRNMIKTGQLRTLPGQRKIAIIPVETRLTAGEYQVDWHAVSVDGHKTRGSYRFTVK